jgi:hypothetical protein
MPLVFPNEGPGFSSAALDKLRQLGALDGSDTGSRMGINPQRLTEQENSGAGAFQRQTPTPRLPLAATPPLEQDTGPLAGLYNAVPDAVAPEMVVQPSKPKKLWAGEPRDAA